MKHVVVNKVVDESVKEGYIERLSKGQAAGVEQLEQVRLKIAVWRQRSRPSCAAVMQCTRS